jgi:hypothetical protein
LEAFLLGPLPDRVAAALQDRNVERFDLCLDQNLGRSGQWDGRIEGRLGGK